jgi:DNA primase
LNDAKRWGVGFAIRESCAGRIWIPIRNRAGQLVNWTARAIGDQEPRYLRASSALDPDKGTIFGEEHWHEFSAKHTIAVMEGELNAIRVDSAFSVPVAGLGGGSKLNPIHAAKLMNFKRLVVFADGDATGDKLTEQLRDLGLPMAVIRFSKGYDPCSVSIADLVEHGSRCLQPKTPGSV